MAESESGQEKTEEPTAKRLEKAKEDGQTARSKELNTSTVLLTGTLGLILFGKDAGAKMMEVMQMNFAFNRTDIFDPQSMFSSLSVSVTHGFSGFIFVFVMVFIGALLAPAALGGFLFSTKALAPKFSRINPGAGIKRMFSMQSFVEFLKSVAKVLVLGTSGMLLLNFLTPHFLSMTHQSPDESIFHSVTLLAWTSFALAATTILIVVIDVPYQLYDHKKKLKMTLQEVKDEMKDSEGKPEVKGRIRQLQQEMANRRMMEAVPDADVVITNPTHFSVAMKYDPAQPGAPVVVAKGVDFMALKIREIAKAHEVVILEAPALARAIYYTTEVEEEIPDGLYVSVAQVLAYVFQLKTYKPGKEAKPQAPKRYDIPKDMTYDESGKTPPTQ